MILKLIKTFFIFLFFVQSVIAREFTDVEGRKIEADLVGISGNKVILNRNGKSGKWPINKLSPADIEYVKRWSKKPTKTPSLILKAWEVKGVGNRGSFKEISGKVPKNIPMVKSSVSKEQPTHYRFEIYNSSNLNAYNLILGYIIYVEKHSGEIVKYTEKFPVNYIKAKGVKKLFSKSIKTLQTKTTSRTINLNKFKGLSTDTDVDITKEKIVGIWAKIYSYDLKKVGEAKKLADGINENKIKWDIKIKKQEIKDISSFDKFKNIMDSIGNKLKFKIPKFIKDKLPDPTK